MTGRKLPLRSFQIRREHLLNYFSTFGAVQNVRIHKKSTHTFGFVTFTRAESAAVALAKTVHKINGREIEIAEADSWHQEKPMEKFNNHEAAATASTKDIELPIELTNRTGTNMLDMNDDCLYEIFSPKLMSIMDLCSVAETCSRLKQIANRNFTRAYKCCNFNELSLKTIHEVRRFLINFGSLITELTIKSDLNGMSVRILDLVIRYCKNTLESLTLKQYEITEYLTAKLRPMFSNLKKIHLENCSLYGDGQKLFANCGSLIELKAIQLDHEDDDGIILENVFPKLERFVLEQTYFNNDDSELNLFVSRHEGLKELSLKGIDNDRPTLLTAIANNCKSIEELRIESAASDAREYPSEYEKELQSILTLNNLKKLQIECARVNVTKFIQELPKLNSLEFLELYHAHADEGLIPALAQLKNLNVLRLSHCKDLKYLKPLGDMKQLNELSIRLHHSIDEITFDLVQMIKGLVNLKKLTFESNGTFDLDKRMYLRIVDVVRERPGFSPSSLEIETDALNDGVVDMQFDGQNNEIVKLVQLDVDYDSDSDSESYFYESDDYIDDDDDEDDIFGINPGALMLHILQRQFQYRSSDDDDDDDEDEIEVW